MEGFRATRDKADGGLETGKRHGRGENEQPRAAEVVLRDLREGDAAVFGGLKEAAALHADDGDGGVDDGHQQTAEDARADGAARHGVRLGHAEAADGLHDHDAEGEARQRVHCIVALQKAGEEGLGDVGALRRDVADRGSWIERRHDDEDTEKDEEAGIEDLTDPDQNFAGTEREEQRRGKEESGEDQEIKPRAALGQDLLQSDSERGRGAAGNGKERANGQVEQTGEEHRVGPSYAAAKLKKSTRPADAECRHAEQRQPYARYTETYYGGPYVAARHLTQVYGEDEVSGAEEQAKEHTGNIEILGAAEMMFHFLSPIFSYRYYACDTLRLICTRSSTRLTPSRMCPTPAMPEIAALMPEGSAVPNTCVTPRTASMNAARFNPM